MTFSNFVALIGTEHSERLGDVRMDALRVEHEPTVIGSGCFVGAGANIMPGVTLGPGCRGGANAVVTKSFPSGSVIGGVPTKLIRTLPCH